MSSSVDLGNLDMEYISWRCFAQAEWDMMLKWLVDRPKD